MNNASKTAESYNMSLVIGAVLIILIATVFAVKSHGHFAGGGTVAYQIDGDIIGIGGKGEADFIRMDDISDVELREAFELGIPLTETEESSIHIGAYSNVEFGEYLMFGYDDVAAYVVIHYSGGITVFNLDNVKMTQSAYNELLRALEKSCDMV